MLTRVAQSEFSPPSGSNVLTLAHDLPLHPNWLIAQLDFYALCQTLGFADFCNFEYSGYNYYNAVWSYYSWLQQPFGKGDGSDGKTDNRLWFATPGFIINYAPTVTNTQDLHVVSVRGQAFLDWMQPTKYKKRRLFVPYR